MVSDALHKTKSQMVFEILKEKVNSGELKPGYKYTVKDLAEQMSISRTPVNEAVKLLAEQGYITILSNVGFTVKKFYWEDIEEIAQIINFIERMIFHRILKRGEEAHPEEMLVFCDAMMLAVEAEDCEAYYSTFWKLHEVMYEQAKINLARDVFRRYWNYNEWYDVGVPKKKSMMLELCRDYEKVAYALMQQNTREVDWIMEQHLNRMLCFLQISLDEIEKQ